MTEDLDWDWARDLFDRTRGAGEPAYTADPASLARAGDRRRRLRTAGAGGGLAGVVAVTMVLAVGLGAGTGAADLGSQAGPGGAWGNRPLSDLFKYVQSLDAVDKTGHAYVPVTAASDLATVLGHLDPSFTHLVGSDVHTRDPRIVATDDAHAKQAHLVRVNSVWTGDSPRRSGELSFGFASSSGWAQLVGVAGSSHDPLAAPCNLPISTTSALPGSSSPGSLPVQWSSCTVSHLQDGSTIGSASGRIGPGTQTVAVREFADGEVFTVVGQDFDTAALSQSTAPDPAAVVKPAPWTEQSLVAALADPAVQSGWNPIPPPNSDGKLLLPSDFGKIWSSDTGQAGQDATGKYLYECGVDQGASLARPGSGAYYWGPLPNGVSGSAYEGEYVLRPGSGPGTMAKARATAQGECTAENGPVDYSKDALIALPTGIGDDAFAESVPGLGMVSVNVRIGDTILRTDLSNVNHVRDRTWTDKTPLDLTSPADRQWLADIARSMVARYRGSAAH